MRIQAPVQPGWGKVPNCGWLMGGLDDPMERHRGLRVPSAGTPTGRGKGMGVTPTLDGVAWPKEVVVVQKQEQLCGGGVGHHHNRDGSGVGR
jgi:hypothetical protein